ncbi:MAG: radical SAM/SPASM domain-containing protein [Bacteroidales bacterium]
MAIIFNRKTYFHDRIRLLKTLSFHRIINYIKILASFRVSSLFNRNIIWSEPFSLNIETASICNLSCPECITGIGKLNRARKLAEPEYVKKILSAHHKQAFYCNLYFQGEPFLNPELFEMISLAKSFNFYTAVSTNGHFLDENTCRKVITSGLDRIIVSIDGPDDNSYNLYRKGGHFKKVCDGVKQLAFTKKRMNRQNPLLVIQMLVNKNNEKRLSDAVELANDLNADKLEFKSMQIYTETGKHEFLPETDKYNRYKNGKTRENSSVGPCFRLWSHMVYTSDERVVPCCYDKTPDFGINVSNGNYGHVWKSGPMMRFRSKLFDKQSTPGICSNCGK